MRGKLARGARAQTVFRADPLPRGFDSRDNADRPCRTLASDASPIRIVDRHRNDLGIDLPII
jgi:hypothetical protein